MEFSFFFYFLEPVFVFVDCSVMLLNVVILGFAFGAKGVLILLTALALCLGPRIISIHCYPVDIHIYCLCVLC